MNIILEVNNLTKVYKIYEKPADRLKEAIHPVGKKYHRDFVALSDVSFKVEKGESIGIIGKNGSGKSTLLKLITGVLTPTSGSIHVKGKIAALLELGAGFNPEMTGLENIYLNGTIMGYSKAEIDQRVKDIVEFADIGDFINRPVKLYSSGMFARLAFALAIHVDPEILIVDEALAVGDIKFQSKCFNKFKELKEKGVTILFVGHDVFSIRSFCDRAIWINEGKLKSIGDTLSVTAEYMQFMKEGNIELQASENDEKEFNLDDIEEMDPINRWGNRVGLIKTAKICNKEGQSLNVYKTGEVLKVSILFYIPADIDSQNLGVAFSIKNKTGLDLIVSSTFDEDCIQISKLDRMAEVTFEFENCLNEGEYILVAALEDRRKAPNFEYYDYIEGARYFKVVAQKRLFGLIDLPITQKISYVKGQ